MLTRGALYIFSNSKIRKPKLRLHISLLKCQKIKFKDSHLIIVFAPIKKKSDTNESKRDDYLSLPLPIMENSQPKNDDNQNSNDKKKKKKKKFRSDLDHPVLMIESKFYTKFLYKWIYKIVNAAIYKVENIIRPKFEPGNIAVNSIEHEAKKHSLKRRAVLMAHYCFFSGESLECADYFQSKWDGKSDLVIGPQFHPGGYAVPFGCAVGFEISLKSLIMKNAHFEYFSGFLSAVLVSAQTIRLIAFKDYQRGKSFQINFYDVKSTNIKRWTFINCCSDMINSFADAVDQLPSRIHKLTIGKHSYNKEDATSIFNGISNKNNLQKLKKLIFTNINFQEFPRTSFTSLCSSLEVIENLELSHINIDGSLLFTAACKDSPKIRKLILNGLKFEKEWAKPIGKFNLPTTLALLDISETQFYGPSFANLLQNITLKGTLVPFFFVARSLHFAESVFQDLDHAIDFSKCQSNILEFDLSDNMIPKVSFEMIFHFINTQKRLRNLIFNNIITDDQTNFMFKLSSVELGPNFAGIDLSGEFKPLFIQQFISSVPGSSNLRRLSIKDSKCGNNGYILIEDLLNILKSINEIEIDGIEPSLIKINKSKNERHPIINCWKKIQRHRSITANDLPIKDMAKLGFAIEKSENEPLLYTFDSRFTDEDREMLTRLSPPRRAIPTTMKDRLQFLVESMKSEDKNRINRAISPDIFLILNKNIPDDYKITKEQRHNTKLILSPQQQIIQSQILSQKLQQSQMLQQPQSLQQSQVFPSPQTLQQSQVLPLLQTQPPSELPSISQSPPILQNQQQSQNIQTQQILQESQELPQSIPQVSQNPSNLSSTLPTNFGIISDSSDESDSNIFSSSKNLDTESIDREFEKIAESNSSPKDSYSSFDFIDLTYEFQTRNSLSTSQQAQITKDNNNQNIPKKQKKKKKKAKKKATHKKDKNKTNNTDNSEEVNQISNPSSEKSKNDNSVSNENQSRKSSLEGAYNNDTSDNSDIMVDNEEVNNMSDNIHKNSEDSDADSNNAKSEDSSNVNSRSDSIGDNTSSEKSSDKSDNNISNESINDDSKKSSPSSDNNYSNQNSENSDDNALIDASEKSNSISNKTYSKSDDDSNSERHDYSSNKGSENENKSDSHNESSDSSGRPILFF